MVAEQSWEMMGDGEKDRKKRENSAFVNITSDAKEIRIECGRGVMSMIRLLDEKKATQKAKEGKKVRQFRNLC